MTSWTKLGFTPLFLGHMAPLSRGTLKAGGSLISRLSLTNVSPDATNPQRMGHRADALLWRVCCDPRNLMHLLTLPFSSHHLRMSPRHTTLGLLLLASISLRTVSLVDHPVAMLLFRLSPPAPPHAFLPCPALLALPAFQLLLRHAHNALMQGAPRNLLPRPLPKPLYVHTSTLTLHLLSRRFRPVFIQCRPAPFLLSPLHWVVLPLHSST